MAVDTYRPTHTRFFESRNIIGRGKTNKYAVSPSELAMLYNMYLKAASDLPFRIKTKADFIIADTAKGSFLVIEAKKGVGRVGARQMPSYLQMPVIAEDRHILRPETDVQLGATFVHEGIGTLSRLAKVARPIEIEYLNREHVETLLGSEGKYVLEQVLSVVKDLALGMDWPLDRVEIRYTRDTEVEDWEYGLILLVFTCDFDTANRHLHELYNQIDMLTDKLSDEEQEILRRMIFFDIETKASIFST
ncbi:MAG: hypothetical protein E3J60_00970 [Dehalococcoidia bacterium]|nr:MAG: hypothetical protein E3J60_00970 [Dehalococcoidia bacterium]